MSRSQIKTCFAFAVLLFSTACHDPAARTQEAAAQPDVKLAPPTPIAEYKEELGKPAWNPEWDITVQRALPAEFMSDDVAPSVRQFCPRFAEMSYVDRRAFWAYVFQALAAAEAGLVPTTNVQHTEPEVAVEDRVTKRMVRSEGLLQLTYMDRDRYDCDFDWDHDRHLPEHDPDKTILQPENNLACGVKIMANQILVRKKPLVSPESYWSTLRPGTISYRVLRKQMANVPDVCRAVPLEQANLRVNRSKPMRETAMLASNATAGGTN